MVVKKTSEPRIHTEWLTNTFNSCFKESDQGYLHTYIQTHNTHPLSVTCTHTDIDIDIYTDIQTHRHDLWEKPMPECQYGHGCNKDEPVSMALVLLSPLDTDTVLGS